MDPEGAEESEGAKESDDNTLQTKEELFSGTKVVPFAISTSKAMNYRSRTEPGVLLLSLCRFPAFWSAVGPQKSPPFGAFLRFSAERSILSGETYLLQPLQVGEEWFESDIRYHIRYHIE